MMYKGGPHTTWAISMSCQPANSVMARPFRPDPHPRAAGHPGGARGGGAGGCAANIDISSTFVTNAGRSAGRAVHMRGDAMGIPRPPPPPRTTAGWSPCPFPAAPEGAAPRPRAMRSTRCP